MVNRADVRAGLKVTSIFGGPAVALGAVTPWLPLSEHIRQMWAPYRHKHPHLGPGGQPLAMGSSRQQRRAAAFRAAFARASDPYGQTNGEPRRARRRIARQWARARRRKA